LHVDQPRREPYGRSVMRTDRQRVILVAAALVTLLGGCSHPPAPTSAQSDPTASTGPSGLTPTTSVTPSTAPTPTPRASTARPASTTKAPTHFTTLAPGSKLPGDSQCAAWVRLTTYKENKAVNRTANNTTGQHLGSAFFSGDDGRANSVIAARVDGQFTGTTHQILRWAACKWGIDEDLVYAQAAIESWWRQTTLGDWGTDASRCPPGHGLGVDGKAGQCPESWGILQNRYPYEQSSWPGIGTSTAMNADLAYGIWRTCFEGYETWLNTVAPAPNPPYRAGDAWGCIGRWFSGRWHNSDAEGYITRVKDYLNQRIWETPNFQEA
jgi:hypothetical protein